MKHLASRTSMMFQPIGNNFGGFAFETYSTRSARSEGFTKAKADSIAQPIWDSFQNPTETDLLYMCMKQAITEPKSSTSTQKAKRNLSFTAF